jgi:hypothetical protein
LERTRWKVDVWTWVDSMFRRQRKLDGRVPCATILCLYVLPVSTERKAMYVYNRPLGFSFAGTYYGEVMKVVQVYSVASGIPFPH